MITELGHYLENIIDFTQDGPLWWFLDLHLRADH